MKIAITEDQIVRLKLNLKKQGINEDFLDDIITKGSEFAKKGIDAAKDFISGLDVPVEKKSADISSKADFISADTDKFFEVLKNIDEPLTQQQYGSMTRQQGVEAVQIALQLLGYELPRFGTDGLFGPETAQAVNKYKGDKNIDGGNDLHNLEEANLIAPMPLGNIRHGFDEKRGNRVHGGIDIPAKVGTPIVSIADGKVIAAGALDSRCGDGISIQHADGFVSSYCHLSNVGVSVGESVKQGDRIGLTGGAKGAPGSGNSTGPHLHLTLKKNGQRVDPMQYFGSSIGSYSGYNDETIATITPEMVSQLISDLEAKNITNDDLKNYVDPAVTTGGGEEFTDLDLTNPEEKEIYKKICDNYIKTRDPNAQVNGKMMADAAEKVYKKYGKYVPAELALAQLTLEGGIGAADDSVPMRTKNPFNIGNTGSEENQLGSFEEGVNLYYDLMARKYLVKGKTAKDLINDFVNDAGNRYAQSSTYEAGLKSLIKDIRRKNQSMLSESLLLEADKRQAIKNAFGFNDAWADEFHRMSDKLSVWIASTFINKLVERYRNEVPEGEDPRRYVVTGLNQGGPNATADWRSNFRDKYEYIMHWIRAPRREQLNIRELSFDQAYAQAEEWHESLQTKKDANYQETGDVFIDYRNSDGVGYYWVHLHKNYCSEEANRMGHCARSNSGQLISFRRINDFGEGESYLTVDYRPGGIIGDFHRHGNKKPTARFHRQIVDFLTNTTYPVTALTRQGVHRYEENFHLTDLSPADLRRVYAANPALRYDINNEDTWSEIIDAILSDEYSFDSLTPSLKLKLLKKSKSLNKQDEFKSKFTKETVINLLSSVDNLDKAEITTLTSVFGDSLNDIFKEKFDLVYNSSSSNEAKDHFIDSLRAISQDMFHVYQTLCDYIDYGFKKFSEETRVEIVASRGIKRTLFACTDTIPFLSRYVDNTRIDVNGNISVKTEEGLWGLVKQNGETILLPQFLAVAPNPIDRGKTYMVKNQNGEFFKLSLADMSYTKLERKR